MLCLSIQSAWHRFTLRGRPGFVFWKSFFKGRPMSSSLARARTRAYIQQSGLCYYCDRLMWNDADGLVAMTANANISRRKAGRFQCTAEHLIARSEGGLNSQSNIAAACRFCNMTRHRSKTPRDPLEYRKHVQNRLRRKKWQPL
ncbi:HNH endonuclease [Paraburkholderia azotifigens]|uniref:HNH endonuclease n=3 Tax=Paraburkholderia azotifigens TaxID=2057004 RepID=A0ABU9R0L1_9BURK